MTSAAARKAWATRRRNAGSKATGSKRRSSGLTQEERIMRYQAEQGLVEYAGRGRWRRTGR